MKLRLGSRGSKLARVQSEYVARTLRKQGLEVEIVWIQTRGDRILDKPLAEIGEKGLFTQELDRALLEGDIDFAVHSLKDLPSELTGGLQLTAIPPRYSPLDAFVAHPLRPIHRLSELPEGATVATSSLRRKAQLLAFRPDLRVVPVRGNVDTRLRKLDEGDWEGLLLAEAGLIRLQLEHRITQRIPASLMLPAAGQGALGIVTATHRTDVQKILRNILHDPETEQVIIAERAFLQRLEGGCQVPIGTLATILPENRMLFLQGMVASLDGRRVFRGTHSGIPSRAKEIGIQLAERLLQAGAEALLQEVRHQTP